MSPSPDPGAWRIQPATEDDLDVLVAIEKASFETPWSETSLRSALTQERSCVYLATLAEVPIAYANFQRLLDECELLRLAVDPGYRRQRIGQRLLDHGLHALRRQGCRQCHLEVRQDNAPARRLYETLGFKISGRRKGYYRQGSEALDAILYCLPLIPTQPEPRST